MNDLINFCDEINLILPPPGIIQHKSYNKSAIFDVSVRRDDVCSYINTIIKNNINTDKTLYGIDFFCGHGHILNFVKQNYKCELIGIDINKFPDWLSFNDIKFYQKDVFDVIKINPTFKFDIVMTFNTLRANPRDWGENKFNEFLNWCSKHSTYLITNNCTNKELINFQLIDTIKVPNFFDINLFKVTENG